MIKREKRKTYYETNVIVDVICDCCGKSIANEDWINQITASSLFFIEGHQALGGTDFSDYSLDLCEKCAKPILTLIKAIDDKERRQLL